MQSRYELWTKAAMGRFYSGRGLESKRNGHKKKRGISPGGVPQGTGTSAHLLLALFLGLMGITRAESSLGCCCCCLRCGHVLRRWEGWRWSWAWQNRVLQSLVCCLFCFVWVQSQKTWESMASSSRRLGSTNQMDHGLVCLYLGVGISNARCVFQRAPLKGGKGAGQIPCTLPTIHFSSGRATSGQEARIQDELATVPRLLAVW